jgi:hypothetical protein
MNIKIIEGYPDYEVSTCGKVFSNKRGKVRELKSTVNSRGYLQVALYNEGLLGAMNVHKLVAMAFLGYKPDGMKIVVDHINCVKTDNNVSNLQLITQRENSSKDKKGGTSKYIGVIKLGRIWRANISIGGKQKYLGTFNTELEASAAYQEALSKIN